MIYNLFTNYRVTRKAEKPLILGLKEQLICTSIAQWQYKNRGVETNIAENETINVVCAEKCESLTKFLKII